MADILDVARADALLAGAHTAAGRLLFPFEPRLHGRHAGIDQQQGLIVLRDQGKTRQAQMFLAFKKTQEQLPQIVYAGFVRHHRFLQLLIFFGFEQRNREKHDKKSACPNYRGEALLRGTTLICFFSEKASQSSANGDGARRSSRRSSEVAARRRQTTGFPLFPAHCTHALPDSFRHRSQK